MDHVTQVIAAIAPNDLVERFEGLGVRVLKEEARFVGRTELQAGPHRVKSRRIVLATGSRPTAPPIPGLADVPYFTNETDLRQPHPARPSDRDRRRADRP